MLHERTSWVLGLHWTTWVPTSASRRVGDVRRRTSVSRGAAALFATLALWIVSGLMEVVF